MNKGRTNRRSFVKMAAISALGGLSLATRGWSQTAGRSASSLGDLPSFDGEMSFDDAHRLSVASDNGGHVRRKPLAVLRPRSTDDVVRAVKFANKHELKIAMRGRGHSQYGQSQVEDGIIIDSRTLNSVRLHDEFIDAQPGVIWGDVAKASLARGLTPPVLLDVPVLTVGGTLSVGGTGEMSHRYGTQVDNVVELDVVTGSGEFLTCSPKQNAELFHTVLAGLGQCGIIVRARLRLIRAPKLVSMRALVYDELDTFLEDQARLSTAESLGPMSGEAIHEPNGDVRFVLHAGSFVESADDGRHPTWISGLRFKREQPPTIGSYLEFLTLRSPRMGGATLTGPRVGRAALVATLPDTATQDFTTHVLTTPDASLGIWRFEISPRLGARQTSVLHKIPQASLNYELRMHRQTAASGSPDHLTMMGANVALLPRLQQAGGKIYPPYCPPLSLPQWREHYGAETWQRFAAAKKRFDPNNVLTPGAGIF